MYYLLSCLLSKILSQDVRKLQTKLSRTVQLLSHIREKVSHAKVGSDGAYYFEQ